mgnify:CR=1 FL=1
MEVSHKTENSITFKLTYNENTSLTSSKLKFIIFYLTKLLQQDYSLKILELLLYHLTSVYILRSKYLGMIMKYLKIIKSYLQILYLHNYQL